MTTNLFSHRLLEPKSPVWLHRNWNCFSSDFCCLSFYFSFFFADCLF